MRPSQSLGSGVLVSVEGLIITNHHVVKDAAEIKVNLADGREMMAELVGQDPKSDVAVIRISEPPNDLKPIPLGSSEALRLGETVLAVGNPFGLGHTVTMGIVSAKGRSDLDITDYEDFIQTDAAINPGNSGGALLNLKGQLVGINTAIFSRSGGHQGIGFAIPADMAASIMTSLVETGHVSRGYLGVGIQPLTKRLAQRFGLNPNEKGVLINGVGPGTPAEAVGLLAGDVVLAVDEQPMSSPEVLRNTIAMKGAETTVKLKIWRDSKTRKVPITLGLLPDESRRIGQRKPAKRPNAIAAQSLGIELAELGERNRQRLGIGKTLQGVLITRVSSGSRADRGGLRAGDILTQVNRKKVKRPQDLIKVVKASGDEEILLRIHRGNARLYVVL